MIEIYIHGFSDKIQNVSKIIIDCINNAETMFQKSDYDTCYENYKKNLENFKYNKGYETIGRSLHSKINSSVHTNEELLDDLTHINFEDLFTFFRKVNVIGYVCGNVTKEESMELMHPYLEYFEKYICDESYFDFTRYIDVSKPVFFDNDCYNEKDTNSCTLASYVDDYNSFESPDYYRTSAITSFLSQIMNPTFFTLVRTGEQFGYAVGIYEFALSNSYNYVNTIAFLIQSDTKTTTEINDRIKMFVEKYIETLEEMPESNIEELKVK